MRGCARCRRNSWRATRPRSKRGPVMTSAISDQVPRDSPGAREIGFAIPERYNASRILFDNLARGHGDRLALTGPGGDAHLCRTLRRGRAMGPRLSVARPEARRPHPDVPRRYAGLSGGILRRGARGLRAAADQHADAAGSAAILSLGCRRDGRGRRCRICSRFNAEACKDTPLQTLIVVNGAAGEHAVPKTLIVRTMAARLFHRTGGSRHRPRRDGVLDVFVRLDRTAQGHRASAARHGL